VAWQSQFHGPRLKDGDGRANAAVTLVEGRN